MRNGEKKGIEKNVLQGLCQNLIVTMNVQKEMERNNMRLKSIDIHDSAYKKVSC